MCCFTGGILSTLCHLCSSRPSDFPATSSHDLSSPPPLTTSPTTSSSPHSRPPVKTLRLLSKTPLQKSCCDFIYEDLLPRSLFHPFSNEVLTRPPCDNLSSQLPLGTHSRNILSRPPFAICFADLPRNLFPDFLRRSLSRSPLQILRVDPATTFFNIL